MMQLRITALLFSSGLCGGTGSYSFWFADVSMLAVFIAFFLRYTFRCFCCDENVTVFQKKKFAQVFDGYQ